jgi:hypothetical protein
MSYIEGTERSQQFLLPTCVDAYVLVFDAGQVARLLEAAGRPFDSASAAL